MVAQYTTICSQSSMIATWGKNQKEAPKASSIKQRCESVPLVKIQKVDSRRTGVSTSSIHLKFSRL